MSDDTRVRALLHRYAGQAPTLDMRTDLWERGRTRRQRGRYAGVGAVVVATALAVVAYGALGPKVHSRPMPAGPIGPTPSATQTPVKDIAYKILPSEVYRAKPVLENPLLRFTSGRGTTAIYPDGLVVLETPDGRYSQLRLNEAGIASILSTVTSTGRFEPQDDGARLMTSGPNASLTLDSGSGWVTVAWGTWSLQGNPGTVKATPSQMRDLDAVRRFLRDPSSWSLPRTMYADPEIKPFWAYNYSLSYEFGPWDLDKLPEPVAGMVAELSHRPCSRPITARDARDLLDALVEAGFKPGGNHRQAVYVQVPSTRPHGGIGPAGGDTLLIVSADIPTTCGYAY